MGLTASERLYDLLPYLHRLRDADHGEPLRQLLSVIGEQVELLEADIAQLYDNWFIETAESWAVPYLGELIGYTPVSQAGPAAEPADERGISRNAVLTSRQEVANTLTFRRRKGTLALLEELSRTVAGWPARAVELQRSIGWAPHMGRTPRDLAGHRFADLRQAGALAWIGTPFDVIGHSVDVRRIVSSRTRGRHNIPSVGVFTWRLRPGRVTNTEANRIEEAGSHCFSFSAIGHDTQLFTRPDPEADPSSIAGPLHVPAPIGRLALEQRSGGHPPSRQASPDYYGEGRSFSIRASGWPRKEHSDPITVDRIVPADLSDWDRYQPPEGKVAVDPVLGRMVFRPSETPRRVYVSYHSGFSADIGGGEYDRPLPQRSARAFSRFTAEDVIQAAPLLDDLQERRGELATYLASRWTPEHEAMLAARTPGDDPDVALGRALIEELDLVLDDAALFTQERFPVGSGPGTVPAELASLAEQGVAAWIVRVNRRLLEEALSEHLAVSYTRFVVHGDREAPISPLWPAEYVASIDDGLERWHTVAPRSGVIELARSGVYYLDGEVPEERDSVITLRRGQRLHVTAGQRTRPVVIIDHADLLSVEQPAGSELILDGLLIADGAIQVTGPGDPAGDGPCDERPRLVIRHTTLVPGWALSSDCEPRRPTNPSLELIDYGGVVSLSHSIVGAIRVEQDSTTVEPIVVNLSDTILDATGSDREAIGAAGAAFAQAVVSLRRVTVIGEIHTHAIELGEDTIFHGAMRVARRQHGCLRFCSVMLPSRTPRRSHCQPDLAEHDAVSDLDPARADFEVRRSAAVDEARRRVRPRFNSTRYGRADYCQLADDCALEIARGAESESELGAFHDLYQPQRAANLAVRLAEHVPAGMDGAILHAT